MAARPASRFVCAQCAAVTPKWAGRCETCGAWNSIAEEALEAAPGLNAKAAKATTRKIAFTDLAGTAAPPQQIVNRAEVPANGWLVLTFQ